MTDANEDIGKLSRVGGNLQGQLTRHFDQSQQQVWEMLTLPEKFQLWLAPGTIELRQGGAVKINFTDSGTVIDSKVSAFEAQKLLEYSWGGANDPARPVRWALAPAGGGTQLTLTVSVPQNEDIARACAGWEAHLMMMMAALEGVPMKFPFDRFKSTREAYKAQLARLG
jgi:uncharacterized protein YndB with AHSA1/START domain